MTKIRFPELQAPTPFRSRLKTAFHVLRNRPVVFRVGITHARVYLPHHEGMRPAHMCLTDSYVRWVDKRGDVMEFSPMDTVYDIPGAVGFANGKPIFEEDG